jgi:hypothetical protein
VTGELNCTEEKEGEFQQSFSKIRQLIKSRDSAQAYTWLKTRLLEFLGKCKLHILFTTPNQLFENRWLPCGVTLKLRFPG